MKQRMIQQQRRRNNTQLLPGSFLMMISCFLLLQTTMVTASVRRRTELVKDLVDLVEESTDDEIKQEELVDAVVHDVQELIEEEEEEEETDDLFHDDDALFSGPTPIYQKSPSANLLVPWISVIGVIGMIFTAWQMADHPDGIWAVLCRTIMDSIRCIIRIVTTPCRRCCGRHEPYGRISTMDYGYGKNPALELS